MENHEPIHNLTVDQLTNLIRQTVQEAMIEVLVEYSVAMQHDADIVYQAEITDLLRASLRQGLAGSSFEQDEHKSDD